MATRDPRGANRLKGRKTAGRAPRKLPAAGADSPDDALPELPLYIGIWLDRADIKQAEVVKGTGYGKSFISLLVSGKRRPSVDALYRISVATKIPMNAFFKQPPSRDALANFRKLRPDQIEALGDLYSTKGNVPLG